MHHMYLQGNSINYDACPLISPARSYYSVFSSPRWFWSKFRCTKPCYSFEIARAYLTHYSVSHVVAEWRRVAAAASHGSLKAVALHHLFHPHQHHKTTTNLNYIFKILDDNNNSSAVPIRMTWGSIKGHFQNYCMNIWIAVFWEMSIKEHFHDNFWVSLGNERRSNPVQFRFNILT